MKLMVTGLPSFHELFREEKQIIIEFLVFLLVSDVKPQETPPSHNRKFDKYYYFGGKQKKRQLSEQKKKGCD
jgi:hypothetical protein